MDTFAEDLIALLVGAGLGIYGTTLFLGSKAKLPSTTAPILTITETTGAPAEGTHNLVHVPAYTHPSAQIIARAEDYDAAKAHAWAAHALLFPIRNQFVHGTWWRSVSIVQPPFDLLPDAVGRARFAFNLDAVKRLSPATS